MKFLYLLKTCKLHLLSVLLTPMIISQVLSDNLTDTMNASQIYLPLLWAGDSSQG